MQVINNEEIIEDRNRSKKPKRIEMILNVVKARIYSPLSYKYINIEKGINLFQNEEDMEQNDLKKNDSFETGFFALQD